LARIVFSGAIPAIIPIFFMAKKNHPKKGFSSRNFGTIGAKTPIIILKISANQ
jgi:hypothetical protein